MRNRALRGADLVPNVARLCAMNLFLHGIGADDSVPVIRVGDSLEAKPEPVDMVLTNPPFGKKSSYTIIGADGKTVTEKMSYQRDEFWATTSNKQLNFVQHIYSMLKVGGRAAVVVPDNVLFEGGAGEKIRRALLHHSDVHTLLRLPTGIWYSPGVKANVLFFDRKEVAGVAATKDVWVYDLRSEGTYSIRSNAIKDTALVDFVKCYCATDRTKRKESAKFRRFGYAEIVARDKASLDVTWARATGESLTMPTHQVLMKEILEELQAAIAHFAEVDQDSD